MQNIVANRSYQIMRYCLKIKAAKYQIKLSFIRVLCYNISMKQADNSRTSNTEMITISRAEYEALQAELAEQKQQLESKRAELESKSTELAAALLQNQWLQEQLLLKKKKIFGTSSEQIDQLVMEQFAHLFNEAEGWDQDSYVPATKVKAHSRKRRSGSITDAVPEGTAVEVVEHRLAEEERMRDRDGGDRQRSAPQPADGAGEVLGAGRLVLYLCLQGL